MNERLKNIIQWSHARLELVIWVTALILLALSDPNEAHYGLCPISNMGFGWCPGCGLGHAISYLFRLDVVASFNSHPLGFFAIVVLLMRIIVLINNNILSENKNFV